MLPDRFFYPFAIIIIAAIIGGALSFGKGEAASDRQIINQGWQLAGPDLRDLTISPGSNGAYVDKDGGYIQLSQYTPDGEGPTSIGVFATLGPAHERAFAGRDLKLTLRARAGHINPLKEFDAAYFSMEGPPSGWTTFELGPEWQDYIFNYSPPIIDAIENVDLIAVFPGRKGDNETLDLASIKVEVLTDRE